MKRHASARRRDFAARRTALVAAWALGAASVPACGSGMESTPTGGGSTGTQGAGAGGRGAGGPAPPPATVYGAGGKPLCFVTGAELTDGGTLGLTGLAPAPGGGAVLAGNRGGSAAGLFVAIPAIVAYNYFSHKAEQFASETNWLVEQLIAKSSDRAFEKMF